MAFKFIVALAFVAVASAGIVPAPQVYHAAPAALVHSAPVVHAAPVAVAQPHLVKTVEEYDPHPQYKYGYNVQDSLSGDSKSQFEERDGDIVRGEYSLIDADGFKRTVKYTADPINGFNANVQREPLVKAVAAVPAAIVKAAPVAYAAPTLIKSAPVSYAAPAAYAAPAPYGSPAFIKSVPLRYTAPATYASPAFIKSAPVGYAAPAAYAAPALIKAAPAAYTTYTAPAVIKSPVAYVAHH